MAKLILIDGNAIIHRAFHGLPPFKTSTGELVNAVYGFASILLTILNKEQPDYIAVSFDLKGPTFRHVEYKEYKATRTKAPDELYAQIPRIRDVVNAFRIPIYEKEGFEADDVLGTLAAQAEKMDLSTYIVTGDMDTMQLVTDKVRVLANTQKFSEPVVYDIAKVVSRFGLQPNQIADMKGLQGDSSDNIKGVQGIGPKTACTLLQKYGTLENIYNNLAEITGGVHDKLAAHKDEAFQSKYLATIITNVPGISLDIEACKTHDYDEATLRAIFEQLEFKTLLNRLNTFHNHSSEKKVAESNIQESLF
jgi:DNA polymerase-1